ncbi:MAG: DeoR/GlpR family DNA-binding transcription regulator [Bacillota bacterium]|nr:DeoR/GlpR family DNA-binding transcription regulator [Bacillota bacterium]
MLKTERQDEILNILRGKKHATVQYIAKQVFTSLITVRRDLKYLEDNGIVKRYYGGVSLIDYDNQVVPLALREDEKRAEKSIIARNAVEMIKSGDTVFMDASSTVLRMVDYLDSDKNITVITNSIKTLIALGEKHITAYCTGGLLLENSLAFVGTFAEKAIDSLHADIMFFSSQGLSMDGDITDFSENESHLRRHMMEHSQKKVFLCDSGKIGKTFMFTVCNVGHVDEVVCEKPLPYELISILNKKTK